MFPCTMCPSQLSRLQIHMKIFRVVQNGLKCYNFMEETGNLFGQSFTFTWSVVSKLWVKKMTTLKIHLKLSQWARFEQIPYAEWIERADSHVFYIPLWSKNELCVLLGSNLCEALFWPNLFTWNSSFQPNSALHRRWTWSPDQFNVKRWGNSPLSSIKLPNFKTSTSNSESFRRIWNMDS